MTLPARVAEAAMALAAMLLTATLLGGGAGKAHTSKPARLGTICLARPNAVEPGPGGSVYVLNGSRILQLSSQGRALARLGTTDSTIAVDPAGNLYRQRHGHIQDLSPTGRLRKKWCAGGLRPMAVDGCGNLIVTNGAPDANGETLVARVSPSGRLLSRWRTSC